MLKASTTFCFSTAGIIGWLIRNLRALATAMELCTRSAWASTSIRLATRRAMLSFTSSSVGTPSLRLEGSRVSTVLLMS